MPELRQLNGSWNFYPGRGDSAQFIQPYFNDSVWAKTDVPGNWYLQGNEISTEAWYRCSFNLPPVNDIYQYQISFEGIDYIADVWLNGHYLGHHEGFFQPFYFDLSEEIKVKGVNSLVVRVKSPLEAPEDWSLHKKYIKGVFGHHDTRPGGAWSERGQECSTGGIWGSVRLEVSRNLFIDSLGIKTSFDQNNSGLVNASINVFYPGSQPVRYTVALKVTELNGSKTVRVKKIVTLSPGMNRVVVSTEYPEAKLWWPASMGAQTLYRAEVSLSKRALIRASRTKTFAFRTVVCDSVTKQWSINSKRLFLRGTNYISTQWLSEMNPERYSFDISLMQKAHINAVRVHAHIETDVFYDLCDQVGMLIIQDFPLQWGYSDAPEFILNAERQTREMVSMLAHHPSIIQWVMHNEPPWDADWMKYRYQDYSPDQNKHLDERIFETVVQLDAERPATICSHTKEHPWFGWYSGNMSDYSKPTKQPIISEFGAQALPDMTTLRMILADSLLWPESESEWAVWQYHNFQYHETFDLAGIPKGTCVEDLITNTQNYQAQLNQLAAESYRRQRYNPVTAIFQFMFSETWPSINWGMLDYQRNPKPGYNALALAYQPVLPMAEITLDSTICFLKLMIVNDDQNTFSNAQLISTLKNEQQTLFENQQRVSIAPDTLIELETIEVGIKNLSNGRLFLRLTDEAGKVLGINYYEFSSP